MKNKKFWDNLYKKNWENQRIFPNEELCRFLGRNFKKKIGNKRNVLDIGCGTGNNILPFLHYGFNVIAIDMGRIFLTSYAKVYCIVQVLCSLEMIWEIF